MRYFNIISNKGVNKIEADETILKNIISPCYTYTGGYFGDIADQLLGTFYDCNREAVLLTIPLSNGTKASLKVCNTSSNSGLQFVLYDSEDNIVCENLLYESNNYNINLTHAISTFIEILIIEACKL